MADASCAITDSVEIPISSSTKRPSTPLSLLKRGFTYLEFHAICVLGALAGISFVIRYLRNPNPDASVRLLRRFGAQVGNGVTVKGSLLLDNVSGDRNATGDFSHLSIGDNCYIGDAVFFDLAEEITIESNAVIAGRASFLTHSECGRSSYLDRVFPRRAMPVIVGDGAWVGFGATILPGANIGAQATVGANSLLTRSVEPRGLYAGVPARLVRPLP